MPLAPINGVDLYWETTGQGERVVLTHGSWSDGRTWQSVVGPLSSRFEVVTWDRRGHSRSSDGDGAGGYDQDAADLAALIEHLAGSPVHAVGNSYGASVVLALLAERSDLVATAAAHEPDLIGILERSNPHEWSKLLEREKREMSHVFELIESGQARDGARYFIDEIAVGHGAFDLLPEPIQEVIVGNAQTFLDEGLEPFDPDAIAIDRIGAAGHPLTITSGSESPRLLRAAAEVLADSIPLARLVVMEGAGHIPHRTHADAYVNLLLEVFEGGVAN